MFKRKGRLGLKGLSMVVSMVVSKVAGGRAAALALAVAALLATAAGAWHMAARRALAEALHASSALQQDFAASRRAVAPSNRQVLAMHDLTRGSVGVEALVDSLARSAASHGAVVAAVSANVVEAGPRALGHVDVALTLHGAYGPVREVLDDLLMAHPSVLLRHLSLRRMATPADLETQVGLALLSPPVPASARNAD